MKRALMTDQDGFYLAEPAKEAVACKGAILRNAIRPNGMLRKLLNASKAEVLSRHCQTELKDGICPAYHDFLTASMRTER